MYINILQQAFEDGKRIMVNIERNKLISFWMDFPSKRCGWISIVDLTANWKQKLWDALRRNHGYVDNSVEWQTCVPAVRQKNNELKALVLIGYKKGVDIVSSIITGAKTEGDYSVIKLFYVEMWWWKCR